MQTIGGGGMANVYLAEDTILKRKVAIKVLRLEYANDDEFIARFHREAHSATSLSHPNIVNIYDVGEEDGIYYMVMEYIDGMTLKKYIQTYGALPVEEVLDIMKQITSAIAHAHENGIIHRDIKPQNILIDSYRQIKVTDFGIAVALSATSLTQTNSVLGSVHYLSPEQARGGMANSKSDIYSLGIVMYESLMGKLPFSGESAVSIAIKHLQNETPSLREVKQEIPQSVENIVLRSTAKDPYYRYESVYEMEDELETALEPSKVNVKKFSVPAEDGEITRAIPVFKEDSYKTKATEETLIHTTGNHVASDQQAATEQGSKQPKNKKIKKKKKSFIWLLITTFFIVVLGTSSAIAIPYLLQPKDVEVIDVAGMEYEEALIALRDLELEAVRETMFSDEVAEGYVIKSDPEAGSIVKEGQTVTLFSSKGKERSEFSNYIGKEYSQTKRLLEEKGYKEVIAYEKHSDRPVGEIISQIQPQPESQVIPEETNVIFEISRGPELILLSSLTGMAEQEARDYLDQQNLQAVVSRENSQEIAEGIVIRQHPAPFSQLEENSTVELVISEGPVELPSITHSVTFTVPYTSEEEGEEQTVQIYVEDENRDYSEIFKEGTITSDTEYTVRLVIPPNEVGKFKVIQEEEQIIEREIAYDENGEDE